MTEDSTEESVSHASKSPAEDSSQIKEWELELVKPSHPIWKFLLGLLAVLSMAWGIESGQI